MHEQPQHASAIDLLSRWYDGHDDQALNQLLTDALPWLQREVHAAKPRGPIGEQESLDIVQNAVLGFLRWGPRFRPASEGQFRSLLRRIAMNELIDAQRRATRRGGGHLESAVGGDQPLSAFPMPSRASHAPAEAAARAEEQGWVRLAVQFLDPDERRLLIGSRVDEVEWTALASELGFASADAARMAAKRLEPKLWNLLRKVRAGQLPEQRE